MSKAILKLMLVFFLMPAFAAKAVDNPELRVEIQGMDLAMQLTNTQKGEKTDSVDGRPFKTTFKFRDKLTGKAITPLRPKAWLSLRRSEQVATETSCEAKVRSFASGQLTTRADVDLNSYFVLTLNQDKTVAFINPQVASKSKLEGIVQLPEQGLDWVLTKDGKWLYVTMPEAAAVALIDTERHSLVTTIATGTGSKPTRIALAPDEQSVWVGLDGSPTVVVISRGEKPKTNTVSVGEGLHQISFTPDSQFAVVTNTAANTVSVINSSNLKKLGDIKVRSTPLKAAWVAKAERFYVTSVNDLMISVVDPVKLVVDSQIEVGRGTVDVAADPQGRYVWVVNQLDAKTYIIDSATNTKIAFANTTAEPDQIAFTADYAYVRSLGSEKFALINRKQLEKLPAPSGEKQNGKLAELSVTQIQAGEKPPSALPDSIGVAAMIAPVPEQNGVMVASAPSKTIYYYVEGMMVPMGTLDNYRRIPRALMILDRSLKETTPGVFEVPVNIEKSGNYDVAVMLDQPRIIHCFTIKLEGGSNSTKHKQNEQAKIKLEFLPLKTQPLANAETSLSFKLLDTISGKPISGIQDARLLAFEPPGLWQKREWLQEIDKGVYQATVIFPHSGTFNVLVEVKSRNLEFTGQTLTIVKVEGHRE
ncbi:MAG: YncE family protein [Methyloglobulus sp.]|nr:YncE family protein [Methyloglobulus sp.]